MCSLPGLRTRFVAIVLTLLPVVGCGGGPSYKVGEVEGVLTIAGQPGHKINIQFIPDVDLKTTGPSSMATTDADGKFQLQLMERTGSTQPGAVVGMHRVVLSDLQLAESATGRGIPIRLKQEYTLVGSTPLSQEVEEGKQTIKLNIP